MLRECKSLPFPSLTHRGLTAPRCYMRLCYLKYDTARSLPAMQAVRWMASRAALALFGLLGALVVIELILQAGAAFTGAAAPPAAGILKTGVQRVLCLSDSNVYGIWLPRNRTYPIFSSRSGIKRHHHSQWKC